MVSSIEPISFYGANRATLDLVRNIRLSRLTSTAVQSTFVKNIKKREKKLKLCPGIKHGIKKHKKKPIRSKEKKVAAVKTPHLRQIIKEKFDFSRTPYNLTVKKPRVALNEESVQKRKFFKSTVQTEESKKKELPATVDFEEIKDTEEEPFAAITKDVSKIINHIDWSDDEDYMKPQLTRGEALALSDDSHRISYLTPAVSPLPKITSSPLSEITNQANIRDKFFNNVANKPSKTKTTLMKAASPNDQYQIDAGQKVIGPTECKKCGMVYDIGDPIDEQRHTKYHLNFDELKIKFSKNDNIVGYSGVDRIILIQNSDSKSKQDRIHSILKQTEDELGTGYSFGAYWKAFVYTRHGCVLGLVLAEPNVKAHRAIHSDGIVLLSEDSYNAKCGIIRIWVKSGFRGQKIATTMMNCLRKNFIFGDYLKLDNIAFSITTADGNEFAKKYIGRDDYLTYSNSN